MQLVEAPASRVVFTRAVHAEKSVTPDWVSVSSVMVTSSGEVFLMVSVKTKSPPGSFRLVGSADLVSVTVGRTSCTVTVASSESVSVPPSFEAVAVTVLVWI